MTQGSWLTFPPVPTAKLNWLCSSLVIGPTGQDSFTKTPYPGNAIRSCYLFWVSTLLVLPPTIFITTPLAPGNLPGLGRRTMLICRPIQGADWNPSPATGRDQG